jgi:hypothetical protein
MYAIVKSLVVVRPKYKTETSFARETNRSLIKNEADFDNGRSYLPRPYTVDKGDSSLLLVDLSYRIAPNNVSSATNK